jgi:hypothetical protein
MSYAECFSENLATASRPENLPEGSLYQYAKMNLDVPIFFRAPTDVAGPGTDYLLKTAFIGSKAVGKTALLAVIQGNKIAEKYQPDIGSETIVRSWQLLDDFRLGGGGYRFCKTQYWSLPPRNVRL